MQPSAIPFPLSKESAAATLIVLIVIIFVIKQNASNLQARVAEPMLGATKTFIRTSLLRLIAGLWLAWEGTHGIMVWTWARREDLGQGISMFQLRLDDIEMGRARSGLGAE
jgi:hypothetical protein